MNDTREVVRRWNDDTASFEYVERSVSPSTGGLTREGVAREASAVLLEWAREAVKTLPVVTLASDIADRVLALQQGSGGDRKGVEGSLSPSPSPSGVAEALRSGFGISLRSEPASVGPAAAGTFLIVSLTLDDGREVEVIRSYTGGDTIISHHATPLGVAAAVASALEASPSREPATTAGDGTQADQPSQHEGEGG